MVFFTETAFISDEGNRIERDGGGLTGCFEEDGVFLHFEDLADQLSRIHQAYGIYLVLAEFVDITRRIPDGPYVADIQLLAFIGLVLLIDGDLVVTDLRDAPGDKSAGLQEDGILCANELGSKE